IMFFFSSRRRHTRFSRDWSSDVCSSDLDIEADHGVVGDDVQRSAAGDLGDIDGDAVAPAVQGVQAGGENGGAGDGVGALVEGARSEERRVGEGEEREWAAGRPELE